MWLSKLFAFQQWKLGDSNVTTKYLASTLSIKPFIYLRAKLGQKPLKP